MGSREFRAHKCSIEVTSSMVRSGSEHIVSLKSNDRYPGAYCDGCITASRDDTLSPFAKPANTRLMSYKVQSPTHKLFASVQCSTQCHGVDSFVDLSAGQVSQPCETCSEVTACDVDMMIAEQREKYWVNRVCLCKKARYAVNRDLHAYATLSSNPPAMSLKVPKANNIQLFKDGYKVYYFDTIFGVSESDFTCSKCQVSKMLSFVISKPSPSFLILYGQVLGRTVRLSYLTVHDLWLIDI